jgi:hypothetical protein
MTVPISLAEHATMKKQGYRSCVSVAGWCPQLAEDGVAIIIVDGQFFCVDIIIIDDGDCWFGK